MCIYNHLWRDNVHLLYVRLKLGLDVINLFMRVAVSRKPLVSNANRHIVITAISVLYLCAFANFTINDWYFVDWSLVINGDTPGTMFRSSLRGTDWLDMANSISFNLLLVLSDALLVSYWHLLADNTSTIQ